MESYNQFIQAAGSAQVHSLESSLRNISYILPGRFKDATLVSEVINASLSIISTYNTSLLPKHQSLHTKYTQASLKDTKFKLLAYLLNIIQSWEVVLEMLVRKSPKKWDLIIAIEGVKATIRLSMLQSRMRPLVHPQLPQRSIVEESGPNMEVTEVLPRSKVILRKPSQAEVGDILTKSVIRREDTLPPLALIQPISARKQLAEILYILRPLLYALFSYRQQKAWKPWLLSLSIEYASAQIMQSDYPTRLEKEEYSARGRLLAWYLVRGAFYENYTRIWLTSIKNGLSRIPLAGELIDTIMTDYMDLISNLHFYTSSD